MDSTIKEDINKDGTTQDGTNKDSTHKDGTNKDMTHKDSTNKELLETLEEKYFPPVFMVHSKWSIQAIDKFLAPYGDVGYLRVVRDKDGNETSRTLAIISIETYNTLQGKGYGCRNNKGIVITPFRLTTHDLPPEDKDPAMSLFVPVPPKYRVTESVIMDNLNKRLEHLSNWNIIPANCWNISAPLKSREEGEIRNGCFISFKIPFYALKAIALVKILLSDSCWSGPEKYRIRCYWGRNRNIKQKNNSLGNAPDSKFTLVKRHKERKPKDLYKPKEIPSLPDQPQLQDD